MNRSRGPRAAMVAIIAAIANNGIIGRDNKLPWRLSDDLRRFKALTLGHTVIMGRLTYESMGRPLPERRNIVLSGTADYAAAGATVLPTLDAALTTTAGEEAAFILGGRRLFAAALPTADRLYLTRVHADVEGDVAFPAIDQAEWELAHSEPHPADARNEFPYTFEDYVRATGSTA